MTSRSIEFRGMCYHSKVRCVNPYEYVRKYRCDACGEVMMCACDEEFARRYLPHQTSHGYEPGSKLRIPVTIGFQKNICNTCRGIPEEPHPKAEIYGRTSKVQRYYWREIAFETIRRFAEWASGQGHDDWTEALLTANDKYKALEREVVKEIKKLHQTSPKYVYVEKPQAEILAQYNISIVNLDGVFVKTPGRKVAILADDRVLSAEEFAVDFYRKQGYKGLPLESSPFHALFAIFMWQVVQDRSDIRVRAISFGSRPAYDAGVAGPDVLTLLPEDFGGTGYYARRKQAIEAHLNSLPGTQTALLTVFDRWIEPSAGLREYLWAHREADVKRARTLTQVLPVRSLRRILDYLAADYWNNYLGWPDLLLYRKGDYFLAEVKASRDKLSEKQKRWIRYNSEQLELPFRLVKIHRKAALDNVPRQ